MLPKLAKSVSGAPIFVASSGIVLPTFLVCLGLQLVAHPPKALPPMEHHSSRFVCCNPPGAATCCARFACWKEVLVLGPYFLQQLLGFVSEKSATRKATSNCASALQHAAQALPFWPLTLAWLAFPVPQLGKWWWRIPLPCCCWSGHPCYVSA